MKGSIRIQLYILCEYVLLMYRHTYPHVQGDSIDGPAFVCGMVTLLKQCHVNHTHTFFDMAAQFIRSHVVTAETKVYDTDFKQLLAILHL